MVYCSTCGRESPDGSEFCYRCGTRLYKGEAQIPPQRTVKKQESWWKRNSKPIWSKDLPKKSRNASIVVMVICIFLLLFMYSAFVGNGWFVRSATIYVNAQSTHISNTVTLTIWANGIQIFEDSIEPLEKRTIEYAPFFLDDSESFTIKYQTEGGGLGATGDTYTVDIVKGDVRNLNILV